MPFSIFYHNQPHLVIIKYTWKNTVDAWGIGGAWLILLPELPGVLKLHWVRKVEEVICVEMIQKESLRMRHREKWWADGEKVREGELAQRGSRSESHGSTAFLGGKINQTHSQVHNMD